MLHPKRMACGSFLTDLRGCLHLEAKRDLALLLFLSIYGDIPEPRHATDSFLDKLACKNARDAGLDAESAEENDAKSRFAIPFFRQM